MRTKCKVEHLEDALGLHPKPEKQIEIGGLIHVIVVPDYMIK